MPRKGFDTVEVKFLCPHCGEIVNDKKEIEFIRSGSLLECSKCSGMIEVILIAPPPVANAISTRKAED